MASIGLVVNGKSVSVDAEPATPLLWVVREHLKRKPAAYCSTTSPSNGRCRLRS